MSAPNLERAVDLPPTENVQSRLRYDRFRGLMVVNYHGRLCHSEVSGQLFHRTDYDEVGHCFDTYGIELDQEQYQVLLAQVKHGQKADRDPQSG